MKSSLFLGVIILFYSCSNTSKEFNPTGTFIGLEEISSMNNSKNNIKKWYHKSKLTFKRDSIYLEKYPISIKQRDTSHSHSDGGFYYYSGKIGKTENKFTVNLKLINCDYCEKGIVKFIPPKVLKDGEKPLQEYKKQKVSKVDYGIDSIHLIIEKTENVNEILVNHKIYKHQ